MTVAADGRRIVDKYHERDRLRQLRAFCLAAQLGSITRAAEHLGLSQPAVSLYVRELETELDAVLFHRGWAGVSLTPAGERFYELSIPLVQGMNELSVNLVQRTTHNVSGHLRLAASAAGAEFVLPPYIKRFREQHPRVRLGVRKCRTSDGVRLLVDNEVEFVLGAMDACAREALEYRELLRYDIVLITALDHPLAGRETVSAQEACEWPVIAPPTGTVSRRFGDTLARQFGVDANVVVEIAGWEPIKRYVELGFGISFMPSLCNQENDRVSVIALQDSSAARSFGVFTQPGRFVTPAALRLLRLMIPDFPTPSSGPSRRGPVR